MYQDFFLPGENCDKNRLEQKSPAERSARFDDLDARAAPTRQAEQS
jgi:hypothetical protein